MTEYRITRRAIHFRCHQCRNPLVAEHTDAGTEELCPRCGSAVHIPDDPVAMQRAIERPTFMQVIAGGLARCFKSLKPAAHNARTSAPRPVQQRAARTVSTDPLRALIQLANDQRCAEIVYQKTPQSYASRRIVEPYELLEYNGAFMVRCWQVYPPIDDDDGWRTFRIDRIVEVMASADRFQPRAAMPIVNGEVRAWNPSEIDDVPARR